MQNAALEILDHGLLITLAAFVVMFGIWLGGSFLATRIRNRTLLEALRRRFLRDYPGQLPSLETQTAWAGYLQHWDGIRSAVSAALWSTGVSCLIFLFVCFSPWPSMGNFANMSTQPPLRVTFLMVDPSAESFHFEGDVWNQSPDHLSVRASIILLDEKGAELGAVVGPVAPPDLGPRDRGQFVLTLAALPRASSFTLRFLGEGDQSLAYSKGFPNPDTIINKGRPGARKISPAGSR